MEETKKKRKYKKSAIKDTRIKRYAIARMKGFNKTKSQEIAGFADVNHASRIEKTNTYKEIEKKYFKDVLLDKISLDEIAEAHADNIRQDKDRGARNKAIEMAVNRIEPETNPEDKDDQVFVILKD